METTTRFQIILSQRSLDRLDRLQERLDLNSRADVIRDALKLLEAVVTEIDEGSDFWVKDKEGNMHKYKILC